MVDLRTTISYQQIPRNPMSNGPMTKVSSLQQQQLASQHNRRRTSSSNTFPQNIYQPRRASSTASTVSSSSNPSASSQSTYVAQLRRQKATVWCSQSQAEDPRLIAAQKAEKVRATMEITGASTSTSSLFGGNGNGGHGEKIHSKSRSHKNAAYAQPSLLIAAGLPARLSASEVEGDGSDEDEGLHHHPSRSSLARSHGSKGSAGSTASSRRATGISRHNAPSPPRQHTASSSGSGSQLRTPTIALHPTRDDSDAIYPHNQYQQQYQQQPNMQYQTRFVSQPVQFLDEGRLVDTPTQLNPQGQPTANLAPRNEENGYFSGSSGGNSSNDTPGSGTGGLKRQGSVDEREARTLTMSGVRLFVANPD